MMRRKSDGPIISPHRDWCWPTSTQDDAACPDSAPGLLHSTYTISLCILHGVPGRPCHRKVSSYHVWRSVNGFIPMRRAECLDGPFPYPVDATTRSQTLGKLRRTSDGSHSDRGSCTTDILDSALPSDAAGDEISLIHSGGSWLTAERTRVRRLKGSDEALIVGIQLTKTRLELFSSSTISSHQDVVPSQRSHCRELHRHRFHSGR